MAVMDTYITSVPPEELVRDLSAGQHQLYGIGPALALGRYRWGQPDIHVCRFLGTSRMGEADQEQVSPSEAVNIVCKRMHNSAYLWWRSTTSLELLCQPPRGKLHCYTALRFLCCMKLLHQKRTC